MKLPIVRVEWEDSHVTGGWNGLEQYQEREPAQAVTVGFLVSKTSRKVVVVQNMGGYPAVGDGIAIPRGCVNRIEVLGHQEFPDW